MKLDRDKRQPKARIKQSRKTPGQKTTKKEMIGPFGEELVMHWKRFQSIVEKKKGCRELAALGFSQHLNCVQYKARDAIGYAGEKSVKKTLKLNLHENCG